MLRALPSSAVVHGVIVADGPGDRLPLARSSTEAGAVHRSHDRKPSYTSDLTDSEWARETVGRLYGDAHNRNSDGPEDWKRPLFLKRQTADHSFHRAYLKKSQQRPLLAGASHQHGVADCGQSGTFRKWPIYIYSPTSHHMAVATKPPGLPTNAIWYPLTPTREERASRVAQA
ncbi:hypothetical protein IMZ11_39670 [Microtetraspora sp. AC03309]|nr:hypothetical protein [Microtetraspora sp. AC03309]